MRQELDLQDKLNQNQTPFKPVNQKETKIQKSKNTIQLQILEKSLKTSHLTDIPMASPRGKVISVKVEELKSRQKGRQGYLNKRSKRKEWKRRYFILKKPYLYYYVTKEDLSHGIKEKGAIDLQKTVITLNKPDPAVTTRSNSFFHT